MKLASETPLLMFTWPISGIRDFVSADPEWLARANPLGDSSSSTNSLSHLLHSRFDYQRRSKLIIPMRTTIATLEFHVSLGSMNNRGVIEFWELGSVSVRRFQQSVVSGFANEVPKTAQNEVCRAALIHAIN